MQQYGNNPNFKNLMRSLLKDSIQSGVGNVVKRRSQQDSGDDVRNIQMSSAERDEAPVKKRPRSETVTRATEQRGIEIQTQFQTPKSRKGNDLVENANTNRIKSPSDTTIYAPGLQKIQVGGNNERMLDKISNFVESVPMEFADKGGQQSRFGSPTVHAEVEEMVSHAGEARKAADKMILDSERFKASVSVPRGNANFVNSNCDTNHLHAGDFPRTDCNPVFNNDDDFFHLTCHIEPSLRNKIEK